jgi:hypothetical protein
VAGSVLARTTGATHVVVGHSHVPRYFVTKASTDPLDPCPATDEFLVFRESDVVRFEGGRRYLINPGALG